MTKGAISANGALRGQVGAKRARLWRDGTTPAARTLSVLLCAIAMPCAASRSIT